MRGCSRGALTRLANSGYLAVQSNSRGTILATGTLRFSCMTSHDEPEPWEKHSRPSSRQRRHKYPPGPSVM
jgi:hypothetical protein